MKRYILPALTALAFAVPAQAQDAKAGFRVEGVLAYDRFKGDFGSDDDQFNPDRDRDFDVAFGVGVGYDFIFNGGFTAGADAEFTESTTKRTVFDEGDEIGEIKIGTDFYLGGRVTAPIGPNFRVVGKLGFTSLKVGFKGIDDSIDDDSDRLNGYRGAVGVHYTGGEDATYYGGEYRYSNYEEGLVRHQVALVIGTRF